MPTPEQVSSPHHHRRLPPSPVPPVHLSCLCLLVSSSSPHHLSPSPRVTVSRARLSPVSRPSPLPRVTVSRPSSLPVTVYRPSLPSLSNAVPTQLCPHHLCPPPLCLSPSLAVSPHPARSGDYTHHHHRRSPSSLACEFTERCSEEDKDLFYICPDNFTLAQVAELFVVNYKVVREQNADIFSQDAAKNTRIREGIDSIDSPPPLTLSVSGTKVKIPEGSPHHFIHKVLICRTPLAQWVLVFSTPSHLSCSLPLPFVLSLPLLPLPSLYACRAPPLQRLKR